MNIRLFYHSLVSDWNHGNAHFLRGITSALMEKGHEVKVYEPHNGWSFSHWLRENGLKGISDFNNMYPHLQTNFYDDLTDFNAVLKDADLVIVHEWNDKSLIKKLGNYKENYGYTLLFHDTHHRSVTAPEEISEFDLSGYDGVLAFGKIIRDLYVENNWADRAWTWHEAADTRVFHPIENTDIKGDLVWIGNWGDGERTEELIEFLIKPVKELGLKAKMYGVRYPKNALKLLEDAGIEYGGYLPSHRVPEVYAGYRCTVHVPRRAYAQSLPGIPTIRPFEALACGVPLISAPWKDTENLFRVDTDFMMVQDGNEMTDALEEVIQNSAKAESLARHGLETIQNYHTCAHRADELMNIYDALQQNTQEAYIESQTS